MRETWAAVMLILAMPVMAEPPEEWTATFITKVMRGGSTDTTPAGDASVDGHSLFEVHGDKVYRSEHPLKTPIVKSFPVVTWTRTPLHLSPDGWLYLCGLHGLHRCRTDGSRLERVHPNVLMQVAADVRGQLFTRTEDCDLVHINNAVSQPSPRSFFVTVPWTEEGSDGFIGGTRQQAHHWRLKLTGASYRISRAPIQWKAAIAPAWLRTDRYGQLSLDGRTEVYRVTPGDTKPDDAPSPATSADWVKRLHHPQLTARTRAVWHFLLDEQPPAAVADLWNDTEAPAVARVAAAAILAGRNASAETFRAKLADLSPLVRERAAVHLGENAPAGSDADHAALVPLLSDNEATVQHGAILAIGRIAAPAAPDVLVNVWRNYDGKDPAIGGAIIWAFDRLGQNGATALADMAASGSDADRDRAVEAVTKLRGNAVAAAVLPMLENPHVTTEQRLALVKALAEMPVSAPLDTGRLERYLRANRDESSEILKLAQKLIDQRKKKAE